MQTVKEKTIEVVMAQPEDASSEEIIREQVFAKMTERGMEDVRAGRDISDEDMSHRIRSWQS